MDVLIIGCGDLGTALGRQLLESGNNTVYGLRRNPSLLPAGFRPIAADLGEDLPPLPRVDAVVYCAAAKSHDPDIYRRVYLTGLTKVLTALAPQLGSVSRFLFTSSTSVFQQDQGEWVDETTEVAPSHFTGAIMAEAERVLAASTCRSSAIRLGGIYGPGRSYLIEQAYRCIPPTDEPPRYSNRIHRDDAAAVLAHLLHHPDPEPLYVATDGDVTPIAEVLGWIRVQIQGAGLNPLKGPYTSIEQRRANKRCRNERLLASGFRFTYPSYQAGYPALIEAWANAKRAQGLPSPIAHQG